MPSYGSLHKEINACDFIGRSNYERLRARAMVLLLRYAAPRISDVVTLTQEHIKGNYLQKRAIKNGRMIRVELPRGVQQALDRLPHPKAALRESTSFFAGGKSSVRSLVKGAQRTLAAVFRLTKVEHAHPHRFRHTLASELLGKGATVEEVAGILPTAPHNPPAMCQVDPRIPGPSGPGNSIGARHKSGTGGRTSK